MMAVPHITFYDKHEVVDTVAYCPCVARHPGCASQAPGLPSLKSNHTAYGTSQLHRMEFKIHFYSCEPVVLHP